MRIGGTLYLRIYSNEAIEEMKKFKKEVIFQFDGVNELLLKTAIQKELNCSTLFDLSHGAGVLPESWPKPIEGLRCGYAGGLSPDNVEQQIEKLHSLVGDYFLWIDMETHIRSDSDSKFDLDKVRSVLNTCVSSGLLYAY
jgi:phosphoribosylanthranilate isomerase